MRGIEFHSGDPAPSHYLPPPPRQLPPFPLHPCVFSFPRRSLARFFPFFLVPSDVPTNQHASACPSRLVLRGLGRLETPFPLHPSLLPPFFPFVTGWLPRLVLLYCFRCEFSGLPLSCPAVVHNPIPSPGDLFDNFCVLLWTTRNRFSTNFFWASVFFSPFIFFLCDR